MGSASPASQVTSVNAALVSKQRVADPPSSNIQRAGDEEIEIAVVVEAGGEQIESAADVEPDDVDDFEGPVTVVAEGHRPEWIDGGGDDVEPTVAIEIVDDAAAAEIEGVEPQRWGDVGESADVAAVVGVGWDSELRGTPAGYSPAPSS